MLSINAEYKRRVERGSTFTLTSDLSCVASILFAKFCFYSRMHVKITRYWKSTLKDHEKLIYKISCVCTFVNCLQVALQESLFHVCFSERSRGQHVAVKTLL